ncbi:hypothetical protein WUBG_12465 [Wuchereria bancrofti]|uniref:Uncharacterized protein n=1 Tax=Wuchereria bancrofti TaxID=6293 RepID=J9AQK3_WUCBA|nr:hypothetical protein WUBG_12465 [Wuchereria bancrofti]
MEPDVFVSNHTITTFYDLKQRKGKFLREHKKDDGVAFDISMDVCVFCLSPHTTLGRPTDLWYISGRAIRIMNMFTCKCVQLRVVVNPKTPAGITRGKKEGSVFFLFVLIIAMTWHRCVAHVTVTNEHGLPHTRCHYTNTPTTLPL